MFRIKIALLSTLLSGLVMVGISLYSLCVIEKVGMERIDREILALGEGHLATRPPREYWQNFERSLRFIYGEDRPENLIVLVKDPWDEFLYKSSHWPPEITENNFPDFDRRMETRPPASVRMEGNPGEDRDQRRVRTSPPPEAYRACEGKRAGSSTQFTNERGEVIIGRCEYDGNRLVLRPDRHPEAEKGGHPVPRIKKQPRFATISTGSGKWRTGIMGTDRMTIIVGINLTGFYEDTARYRWALLAIVPLALILLAGGGWLIALRALRPVSVITKTAERITARALDQRIPLVNADRELTRLVEVINGMLNRLEKSFGQAVRFSADAAHELQTPLTILQGELDYAVQHSPIGSDEQQRYTGLLDEVHHLKTIVQKLLVLARADAGRLDMHPVPADISAIIEAAAEDAGAMAPHLRIEKEITPGIMINADSDLLGQAVRNLAANAARYSEENGWIRFNLSARENEIRFVITNTGWIPEEDRAKIFERFYRVDKSRSKKVPGSGLGLSLAREIIRAHGGDIVLGPDSGNTVSFTMTLPRV